jgi:hypothetical protein
MRSTKSRPNSPATFLQRHRTLDRSSLLESKLPKSSSSPSLKSLEIDTAPESKASFILPLSQPNVSLPTSTQLFSSELETQVDASYLNPRRISQPMVEAANVDVRRVLSSPISTPNLGLDTGEAPESAQNSVIKSPHPRRSLSLQPSVADASEESTPNPTPAFEHENMPFNATENPDEDRQVQSSPQETVQPEQKEPLQSIQQPNHDWYPDQVTQAWQTASPPRSPVVHQYGFQTPGQMQYPYDYSYGYAPNIAPAGYSQYGHPYYPASFSPPTEAARPLVERSMSRSASGDEKSELLNRIQSVLPDLARLLEQSRDVQAPNHATDVSTGRSQLEDDERLTSLQQELDATKKEYERVIRNLVDENCTLKSEAEDRKRRSRSLGGDSKDSRRLKNEFELLQAQHQDLASSVDSIRLSKEELITEKLGAEKHIELLKKDKHIVRDSHSRAITDLKQQHMRELASRDRENQRDASEHKAVLSKVQLDLAALITKHTHTKKDLELARSLEAMHKASAEARSKELDTAKHHFLQQSGRLKGDHHRALESVRQEQKGERQRHEDEIKKYITELEAFREMRTEWDNSSHSLRTELQEQRLALAAEREAHASLKEIHDERDKRTADLAGSMTLWRQKHAELQRESDDLDRILQALASRSTVTESTPELDQTAPDYKSIINETQTIPPSEGTLATSNPTEIAQEAAGTAISPMANLPVMEEGVVSESTKTEAISGA